MARRPARASGDEQPRCGGYTVNRRGDGIIVRCAVCGPVASLTPRGARALAKELRGPLARFETTAPREERVALASMLDAAAERIASAAHRRAARDRR